MQPHQAQIARQSLEAAYSGSMSFPAIVGALIGAGFDGYAVDYRAGATTYYLAEGQALTLPNPAPKSAVAEAFDPAGVAAQVRWAQSGASDYSFTAFSDNVTAAGCAAYLVSFPGRRVLYIGRTGETHVEHFPPD